MAEYWWDEETTRAALTADGWFRTGDCGCADAGGWLYFVSRMGDIVKRAGENISACEVEVAILEYPDAVDVVVPGIPGSTRDEAAKAVVVPKSECRLTAEDVQDSLSLRLSLFKIPSVIEFRDRLPRGEYGEVLKNQLKAKKSTIQKGNSIAINTDMVGQTLGPSIRDYAPRGLELFAFGYGVGIDGKNGLEYLNEHDECDPKLRVPPMFGAMLIVDPGVTRTIDYGYSYVDLLHWGLDIRFHRSIVKTPDRLETKVKLEGLYDCSEGRGLPAQHIGDTYDFEENLPFTNESWDCLIYDGGWGGPKSPKDTVGTPDRLANVEATETIPENQALTYRLFGNYYPQYINWEHAAANGESRPILHTVSYAGVVMRHAVDAFVPGELERITRFKTRITLSVHPGSTLMTRLWKVADGESCFALVDADADETGAKPHLNWGIIEYK